MVGGIYHADGKASHCFAYLQGLSTGDVDGVKKLSCHPAFNIDEEEHGELVSHAAEVDGALKGGELRFKEEALRRRLEDDEL